MLSKKPRRSPTTIPALEENFIGFIRKIDVTLLTAAEEVARQNAGGGINKKEMDSFLIRQDAHIPEARGLRVMDVQGTIRYAVNGVNTRGLMWLMAGGFEQGLRLLFFWMVQTARSKAL